MERSYLICCLAGWFTAKEPNLKADDLKMKIDERLIDSQMTPLGTEKDDLQLLDDLIDEALMSVIGRGFNRSDRRLVR
jgi:hypothetical protein